MKPPVPYIDLTDEDIGLNSDIKKLSREELDALPYTILHWPCGIGNCQSKSIIRDYGIHPWYYWHRKWVNTSECYRICGHHYKKYRKAFKEKLSIPELIYLHQPEESPVVNQN